MEPLSERATSSGGDRRIPAPDPITRDYLLLALRVGKALPGVVDAYFGPAELKAQVDDEAPFAAARLREDASTLEARILREVDDPDRQRWLQAQLVAFEAQAQTLAGDPLPYSDYIACLFDLTPERTDESVFESAAEELTRLVPSGELRSETMADRLTAWDAQFRIHPDRLPALVDWLMGHLRGGGPAPGPPGRRAGRVRLRLGWTVGRVQPVRGRLPDADRSQHGPGVQPGRPDRDGGP